MRKNTKNKFQNIFLVILPVAIFLIVIFLLILGVNSYLDNSSYFKIKRVVVNGLNNEKFAQDILKKFRNKTIFSLDLKKIKDYLQISNPQFYAVEVLRNFPDQLTINLIVRRPIAQIDLKGFFLVDKEGMIVSERASEPFYDAMIISGLKHVSDLSFGKKINLESLKSGLSLVPVMENIKQQLFSLLPELTTSKINIDVSDYPSLYVHCSTLELRFYEDSLIKELKSLEQILPSLKEKINQVKYIDLRFAEPAVSFE
jgi:cell division septal protein FtsQ